MRQLEHFLIDFFYFETTQGAGGGWEAGTPCAIEPPLEIRIRRRSRWRRKSSVDIEHGNAAAGLSPLLILDLLVQLPFQMVEKMSYI